jgi:para-nitrobenzyl esterase
LSATTQQLLNAQLAVEDAYPELGAPRPVVDDQFLQARPLDTWAVGGGADVPVLAGTIRNEVTVFGGRDLDLAVDLPDAYLHGVGQRRRSSLAAESAADVQLLIGQDASSLWGVWDGTHPGQANTEIAQGLMTQLIFAHPAVRFAEARADAGRTTYLYRLDWASPMLGHLGACHSTSVSFFFGNVDKVEFTRGNPEAADLSSTMAAALAAFMRTSDPRTADLPDWAKYGPATRLVQVFDSQSHVELDPEQEIRAALDALDPRPFM